MSKKSALKKLLAVSGTIVVGAAATLSYMLWEYRAVKTTPLRLFDEKLNGMKAVYAADFQFDLSWEEESMQRDAFQAAINAIQKEKPDIILLGGDYIAYPANASSAIGFLKQLSAPLGVYGVFGNHDTKARDTLKKELAGVISFLENESVYIPYNGKTLALHGVEDLWWGESSIEGFERQGADFSILLTHNPDFFGNLREHERALFDLTLAGHTHAGQITFFGLCGVQPVLDTVTGHGERYRYGLKNEDSSRIYITSGLGGRVFGMPLRFGARPEIAVIT